MTSQSQLSSNGLSTEYRSRSDADRLSRQKQHALYLAAVLTTTQCILIYKEIHKGTCVSLVNLFFLVSSKTKANLLAVSKLTFKAIAYSPPKSKKY